MRDYELTSVFLSKCLFELSGLHGTTEDVLEAVIRKVLADIAKQFGADSMYEVSDAMGELMDKYGVFKE